MTTRLRAAGSQGQSWDFETEHELARQETLDELLKILKAPLEQAGGIGKVIPVYLRRPANATAYTDNDVVNDVAGVMLKVPNVARKPGGSFLLHAVVVYGDQAGGGGAETWQPVVWLWQNPRVTILADNAAFTGSYTILRAGVSLDMLVLPSLAAPDGSTVDLSTLTDLAREYACAPNETSVYFDLQTRTAFTPSSGALYTVQFHITQL